MSTKKRNISIIIGVIIILLIAAYFGTIYFAQQQCIKQLKLWQNSLTAQDRQVDLNYQTQRSQTNGNIVVYRTTDHAKLLQVNFTAIHHLWTTDINGEIDNISYLGSDITEPLVIIAAKDSSQAVHFQATWQNLTGHWQATIQLPPQLTQNLTVNHGRVELIGHAQDIENIQQSADHILLKTADGSIKYTDLKVHINGQLPFSCVFETAKNIGVSVNNECWDNLQKNIHVGKLQIFLANQPKIGLSNLVWRSNSPELLGQSPMWQFSFADLKTDELSINQFMMSVSRQPSQDQRQNYQFNAKISQLQAPDFELDTAMKLDINLQNSLITEKLTALIHDYLQQKNIGKVEFLQWLKTHKFVDTLYSSLLVSQPRLQLQNFTLTSDLLLMPVIATGSAKIDPDFVQQLANEHLTQDQQANWLIKLWQANLTVKNLPPYIALLLGKNHGQKTLTIQYKKGNWQIE